MPSSITTFFIRPTFRQIISKLFFAPIILFSYNTVFADSSMSEKNLTLLIVRSFSPESGIETLAEIKQTAKEICSIKKPFSLKIKLEKKECSEIIAKINSILNDASELSDYFNPNEEYFELELHLGTKKKKLIVKRYNPTLCDINGNCTKPKESSAKNLINFILDRKK